MAIGAGGHTVYRIKEDLPYASSLLSVVGAISGSSFMLSGILIEMVASEETTFFHFRLYFSRK